MVSSYIIIVFLTMLMGPIFRYWFPVGMMLIDLSMYVSSSSTKDALNSFVPTPDVLMEFRKGDGRSELHLHQAKLTGVEVCSFLLFISFVLEFCRFFVLLHG